MTRVRDRHVAELTEFGWVETAQEGIFTHPDRLGEVIKLCGEDQECWFRFDGNGRLKGHTRYGTGLRQHLENIHNPPKD